MKIDKGSPTLNYIFGAFILLSTIKVGIDLYTTYKNKKSQKTSCGCQKQ